MPTLVATAALAAVATAWVSSPAEATVVSVRVDSTGGEALFDGAVNTSPHQVDGGDGSGSHPCTGPPGASPAATATGALDDAMRAAGISWRGNWDPSFRDFFIDRIGPYKSAPPDSYWSLTVDGHFSAGGCLTRVSAGDAIRFFYGPLFGPNPSGSPSTGSEPSAPSPQGGPPSDKAGPSIGRLRKIAAGAAGYLRSRGAGEAWARLALALRNGDHPARAAAALIAGKLGSQLPNGSFGGDVNSTAIAVAALQGSRPDAAARAVAWLAGVQSAEGGFGYRRGAAPDVDSTGLAVWALAIAGRAAEARRGGAFVRSAQASDGGFPALPGGASNSQSTGLGLVALRVSHIGPRHALTASGLTPLDYLASLARRNGSIAYDRRHSPTPVWSTSQALLGLTPSAKLSAGGR